MNAAIILAAAGRLRAWGSYLPLALAIGLVVTLLSANFGISMVNIRRLAENPRRVLHSVEVIRQLETILSNMKDAETGQRGFVMTGKDEYLGPYYSALESIRKSVDALGPNFDEPGKREQLNALKS